MGLVDDPLGRSPSQRTTKERDELSYPVNFEMDYAEQRSRLTTFFRELLAIPHFIFLFVYAIGFLIAWVIAWFALLFTGRFPLGLYDFIAGFLRYVTRLTAYLYLGVDAYPPFNGGEHPDYPVRVQIPPPQESYNRLKVFFRFIYAILALVIRYALGIVISIVSFLSWFVIVITGRQPPGLQNALDFSLAYTTRADALIFLITETYPPFGEPSGVTT
jgi:Domain of unknown function (DUF4389)